MDSIKRTIERTLQPLVGLELSAFGRAADLVWIHFGRLHRVPAWKRGFKFVGELAIHVQCPWRLSRRRSVVVGRGDIFESKQGAKRTLFDSRIRTIPLGRPRLKVLDVSADDLRGFALRFDRSWFLEVFPHDSARDAECWRMFIPSGDTDHFVVTPLGALPKIAPWLKPNHARLRTGHGKSRLARAGYRER
jgi:hypothetical protein